MRRTLDVGPAFATIMVMSFRFAAAIVTIGGSTLAGCVSRDPAARMIRRMDRSPADQRPPNWEHTRALMTRTPPGIGEVAPDFTLKTRDGAATLTRSTFDGRPLVLIFGSFT